MPNQYLPLPLYSYVLIVAKQKKKLTVVFEMKEICLSLEQLYGEKSLTLPAGLFPQRLRRHALQTLVAISFLRISRDMFN